LNPAVLPVVWISIVMKNRKTWVSILIAALIVAAIAVIVAIAGIAVFIHNHVDSAVVEAASADAEFAQARARFAGRTPLLELRGNEPVIHRDATAPRREVRSLHILAFDARQHKISRIDLPGWLLRLMSAGGRFRIANLEPFDSDEDNRLTLEDLERRGPGLVLDAERRGGRALVWIE
jgi:hypothetical protein